MRWTRWFDARLAQDVISSGQCGHFEVSLVTTRTPDGRIVPLFSWPTRVYWEDTDAGGVVYHAQYVAFLERARTEWLRARGFGQLDLRDAHALVFAVRAMRIDFRRPARLDDALDVSVALVDCRRASLVIAQGIRRDGELLVDAQVKVAALGADDFRPRAIPAALHDVLKSLETTPE